MPLLGTLPLDPTVPPGGDGGEPITISDPDSATAKAFAALAAESMSRLDAMQGPPQGFKLNWDQ